MFTELYWVRLLSIQCSWGNMVHVTREPRTNGGGIVSVQGRVGRQRVRTISFLETLPGGLCTWALEQPTGAWRMCSGLWAPPGPCPCLGAEFVMRVVISCGIVTFELLGKRRRWGFYRTMRSGMKLTQMIKIRFTDVWFLSNDLHLKCTIWGALTSIFMPVKPLP